MYMSASHGPDRHPVPYAASCDGICCSCPDVWHATRRRVFMAVSVSITLQGSYLLPSSEHAGRKNAWVDRQGTCHCCTILVCGQPLVQPGVSAETLAPLRMKCNTELTRLAGVCTWIEAWRGSAQRLHHAC
jgi:hypothetical protein